MNEVFGMTVLDSSKTMLTKANTKTLIWAVVISNPHELATDTN